MNCAIEIGGKTLAWYQVVRVEARGLRPGVTRTFVELLRLIIDDKDLFHWLTRLYPEDAIPDEAKKDIVLRGPKQEVLSLCGAAPVGIEPPMEMQGSVSGVLGGLTLRVDSIASVKEVM